MIKIFDENKPSYNLGDLLNMPYFFYGWKRSPHANNELYDLFLKTADYYKNSILNIYKKSREYNNKNELIPNIDRIRFSVDVYNDNNNVEVCDNSLYVHIRTGDKGVIENSYIKQIKYLSEKYSKIVILAGIHNDEQKCNIDESKNNLKISLQNIKDNGIYFTVNYDTPDNHLCLMKNCRNLLVHKGGFSVLGSLIFQGNNLYLTSLYEPLNCVEHNILQYLNNYQILKNNET